MNAIFRAKMVKRLTILISDPLDQSSSLKRFLPIGTLICSAIAIYWPVFFHHFQTSWDDLWVLQNNYTENGFTPENLWNILTQFYHGQYAPVNELYYLTLYWVGGYDSFLFHLWGLFIHICNILMVYRLILILLRRYSKLGTLSAQRIAFFTAVLFSIHPFLVEAVAWISASKIILYAFFYLLALHAYLYFLECGKLTFYWFTITLFVLSFGAKEQAVTLPCCLLLLDYIAGRSLKDKKVWLEKVPLFALSIIFGYITFLSQAANGQGVLSAAAKYPFYQNLLFASFSLTEYLTKCLIPVKLSYIYPFPNLPGEPVPLRFWIYPFIIFFSLVGLWNFWKQKWVCFGILFFIIHIAITINLISTARFAIIADRYVYLSAIGVFFMVSYFLELAIIKKNKYLNFVISAGIFYIILLSVYSHERVKVWYDSDSLKQEIRNVIKNRKDYHEYEKSVAQ